MAYRAEPLRRCLRCGHLAFRFQDCTTCGLFDWKRRDVAPP